MTSTGKSNFLITHVIPRFRDIHMRNIHIFLQHSAQVANGRLSPVLILKYCQVLSTHCLEKLSYPSRSGIILNILYIHGFTGPCSYAKRTLHFFTV